MTKQSVGSVSLDSQALTARLIEEGLISLREAATIFGQGRRGAGRHPATLTRDILHGTQLPNGTVVRLEALRVGGCFKTTRQAVLRYVMAQQVEQVETTEPTADAPTPARRRRAADAASAELAAALGTKS